MRVLNVKQKEFIDKWFEENWTGPGSIYSIDQMPEHMCNELQAMNDHETLWDNADRHLNDKALKKIYS